MHTSTAPSKLRGHGVEHAAQQALSAWLELKQKNNASRIASVAIKDAHPSTRPRVVVVDDEPVIAVTLAEILGRHGFDPVWFTDGFQALDFIRTNSIDLLLSDVSMPALDGIRLASQVLELQADCAIFLFSARSEEPEVRERIRPLAVRVHLAAKPLHVETLLSTLRILLPA